MDQTVINALAVAITGAVGALLSEHNRRSDKRDREEKAAAAAEELRQQTDRLTQHTRQQTGQVLASIQANTQLTAETKAEASNAYNAANDLNVKFLKVHSRIDLVEARQDQQERKTA
jgi:hypothetical protein